MGVKKLSLEQWDNIFRNIEEYERSGETSVYGDEGVQAVYLDPVKEGDSKWGLCFGEELFEEGFETEQEALERLEQIEKELLK